MNFMISSLKYLECKSLQLASAANASFAYKYPLLINLYCEMYTYIKKYSLYLSKVKMIWGWRCFKVTEMHFGLGRATTSG